MGEVFVCEIFSFLLKAPQITFINDSLSIFSVERAYYIRKFRIWTQQFINDKLSYAWFLMSYKRLRGKFLICKLSSNIWVVTGSQNIWIFICLYVDLLRLLYENVFSPQTFGSVKTQNILIFIYLYVDLWLNDFYCPIFISCFFLPEFLWSMLYFDFVTFRFLLSDCGVEIKYF